jgi:hypothetical protein
LEQSAVGAQHIRSLTFFLIACELAGFAVIADAGIAIAMINIKLKINAIAFFIKKPPIIFLEF